MKVIVKDLTYREYIQEDINNSSPNCIKDIDFEWNEDSHKMHELYQDIVNHQIVLSYQRIDCNEAYAYFFFNKIIAPAGNSVYVLEKIFLDKRLSEDNIRCFVHRILSVLVNEKYQDGDRLKVSKNYLPYYQPHIDNTKKRVGDLIVREFITSQTGIIQIPDDFMEKLKSMKK